MSMAKFSIKSLSRRHKVMLSLGVSGLVLTGGVAAALNAPSTTPAPVPPKRAIVVTASVPTASAPTPPPVPFAGPARLESLDNLRAQIEEAKLRRDLAKLKAEERDATNGAPAGAIAGTSNMALPPLPAIPVGGIPSMMPSSLDIPPLPNGRQAGGARAGERAAGPEIQFLEAWGSGGEIQGRVQTPSGERIVRVGDVIPGGRVTRITGNALTITDTRGKARTYN